MSRPRLLAIVGPTASGKSDLALDLAERMGGEIVSADSMQVYRGMDIGTAKPTAEERSRVPHHMIDIAAPDSDYSVGQFQMQARQAIEDIQARGKLPLLVGGSGLYVNSITHNLNLSARAEADPALRSELEQLPGDVLFRRLQETDAEAARRIHPNNLVRVRRALEIALSGPKVPYDFNREQTQYDLIIIGLERPRDELYERIDRRVSQMMDLGLAQEVAGLYAQFGGAHTSMQAIGYKEIIAHLAGEIPTLAAAADLIRRNTRHFAKRQLTWFRRDGRIRWLDAGGLEPGRIQAWLESIQ